MSTLAFTKGHDLPVPFDLFDISVTLPWGAAIALAHGRGARRCARGTPCAAGARAVLAVVTLAFAVAAARWLLVQDAFTGGTSVPRPVTARCIGHRLR